MNIIRALQGSDDWLKIRKAHDTASEAPSALGKSKYTSRTDLMRQKHTGITQEIDSAKQSLFDKGHAAEAAARSIAEAVIGSELYPVTGSLEVDGLLLLASLDGITMDEKIIWEHKLYSAKLAEDVKAGTLDPHYTIQLDQQLLVSGSKKCLFMTSDGTEENMAYCWYEPNQEKFDALIAGWKMFRADLAAYVPREIAEKPKAEVVIELPALFVHAKGEITEHNMEAFGMALSTKLAEVRAIALVTDQDFSNAKEAAKKFRETAKAIAISKEAMLSQTETIGEAARKMDAWAKDLNATALQLEKDVEREDMAKKRAMIDAARINFAEYIAYMEAEIAPIKLTTRQPDFADAIKGKRNYSSMHDAIDSALARGKMDADAEAKDIRAKLAMFNAAAASHTFLFADLQAIVCKPVEDFKLLVETRIANHKQAEAEKLEAERARIQQEEEAKAQEKVRLAAIAAEPAAQVDQEQIAPSTTKTASIDNIQSAVVNLQAAVIEHQDDISAFLKSRSFKDESRIRAILVEFTKHVAERSMASAA